MLPRNSNSNNLPLPPNIINHEGFTKLLVICPPMLNQDQLWRLFDIVPGIINLMYNFRFISYKIVTAGLDYCHLRIEGRARSMRGIGTAVYNNPQWAAHALEKFHGFEYPPGYRLIVKPDLESIRGYSGSTSALSQVRNPDIRQLAETIAQATNLIKAAGLSPGDIYHLLISSLFNQIISTDLLQKQFQAPPNNDIMEETVCSVPLPNPQPLANIDEETAARYTFCFAYF